MKEALENPGRRGRPDGRVVRGWLRCRACGERRARLISAILHARTLAPLGAEQRCERYSDLPARWRDGPRAGMVPSRGPFTGKPDQCAAVPLDPLVPDHLQHAVLEERARNRLDRWQAVSAGPALGSGPCAMP